jgi:hypothetical protein
VAKRTGARRRSRISQQRCPDSDTIADGLFLDFEGFAPHAKQSVRPPAICGYRIGGNGTVRQVVFSRSLHPAGRATGIVVCNDWKQFITCLLKENAGRHIFAFSEHEKMVFKLATGHNIRRRYENVRQIAKQWRERHFNALFDQGNTLLDFLMAAGIKVPDNYGKGLVTEKLRRVVAHATSRARWSVAPDDVKSDWKDVLRHNAFDVSSMCDLLRVIERDMTAD